MQTTVTKEIDKSLLSSIKNEWKNLVDNDVFQSEFSQFFEFAEQKIGAGQNSDTTFYAIQGCSDNHTEAILDIVQGTKNGKSLTKTLKVVLSPKYWEISVDNEESDDIASLFATCVTESINIGIDRREGKGFTVKIYGRNNGLFDILLHTYKVLESKKLSSFDVSMQGRWLCLTTR